MTKKYAILLSEDQVSLIHRVLDFVPEHAFNESDIEEIAALTGLTDTDLLIEYNEKIPKGRRAIHDWTESMG